MKHVALILNYHIISDNKISDKGDENDAQRIILVEEKLKNKRFVKGIKICVILETKIIVSDK